MEKNTNPKGFLTRHWKARLPKSCPYILLKNKQTNKKQNKQTKKPKQQQKRASLLQPGEGK